jgi:hypothetical protein
VVRTNRVWPHFCWYWKNSIAWDSTGYDCKQLIQSEGLDMTCENRQRQQPYEYMDSLYSALATLPNLEWVKLSALPEDEITLANPERLTNLLWVHYLLCGPSLFLSSISQAHFVKQQRRRSWKAQRLPSLSSEIAHFLRKECCSSI